MSAAIGAGQISIDDAIDRLDAVLELVDRRQPIADIAQEVLREASARRILRTIFSMRFSLAARAQWWSPSTHGWGKLLGEMGMPVHSR